MMVTVEETARALQSVAKIAIFDRAGANGFGRDNRACARSFWAYVMALPASLLLLGIEVLGSHNDQPVLLAVSRLIGDLIQIAGFPLLLLPLLHWLGRSDRWAWFVTGYNWYSMAQTIAFVTLLCLTWGLPGADLFALIRGAAGIYFIVLEAFLADAILGIGAGRAIWLVIIDLAFGYGVDSLADWIAQ
ncbi:MAG: hypothetical protein WCC64_13870 [Aliidongia sp.]